MTRMVATVLEPAGLAGLAQLLDAANLPSADLADPGRLFFRIEAGSLVGFGGLEGAGADRLLRSIVVVRGSTPMPPRDLIPLKMPAAPGTA